MIEAKLAALWRDPSAAFAEDLRVRLKRLDIASASRRRWPGRSLTIPVLSATALTGMLVAVPQLRAAAASLLAKFRVVNFVAVPVNPDRVAALGSNQLDLGQLIGDQVQVLEDGTTTPVSSIAQAEALSGLKVRLPLWLPDQATIVDIAVTGERAVQVTGDAIRLRQVLDTLGISDLSVPDDLDGKTATIRVPPVVMVRYEHGGRHTRLFEAMSPEITLPVNIDLGALGEVGLRILGMSPSDAREFGRSIDWTNTLIVPIPPTARAFRQVDVGGNPGVWVGYQAPGESSTNMVLWSHDDRVFGLVSIQAMDQVLEMANSIQ